MNAVGIDVSKGKSMMMALQPMNQVVLKPREYPHTEAGLDQMAHDILRLGEDTRVIMEATGRYHEPVAAALYEHGIRVTVMNPLFIKQSCGGSIRKVKTDKADARKIAKYGLDNWMDFIMTFWHCECIAWPGSCRSTKLFGPCTAWVRELLLN